MAFFHATAAEPFALLEPGSTDDIGVGALITGGPEMGRGRCYQPFLVLPWLAPGMNGAPEQIGRLDSLSFQ